MYLRILFILSTFIFIVGCSERKQQVTTPWGTSIGEDDSVGVGMNYSYDDIISNGELIVLTMSGPDTYFEYQGRNMGTQYLLCEKFAQKIGVSLRVEVCKDTAEVVRRLEAGDADIAMMQFRRGGDSRLLYCGASSADDMRAGAVSGQNKELADSLDKWYNPSLMSEVRREERRAYSSNSVHRHVYAPVLNATRGQISPYDEYFKMYAPGLRWDWRLLAAQCYQESTFDPKAYSWAGARGLMQIMPSTAASLGLAETDMYSAGPNIEAATRYIARLNGYFADVRNADERINFVLASYNGGHFHIRDAMALARKYGRNQYSWAQVSEFVSKLSSPTYYRDPVVKYGYMRGSETVGYVSSIRQRWDKYRRTVHGGSMNFVGGSSDYTPRKASRKSRFSI